MPKYYVQSGQVRYIIDRPNEHTAISAVLHLVHGKGLLTSLKICVSQAGFDIKLKCYDTDSFLKK
jgi:hypothetical protein